jgi:hypothetical protein
MENRNPESAYTILDNIQPENVTSKIIDLKKYAVGMALAKMGDYKKALNLIKNDWSYPANTVRLELFWLRENWFGLKSITEDRFDKYEENLPNPLTTKHTQEIMRLAVAYAAQNSQDKMEALSNRFRERIENPSDIKLLDYLTSGSKKLNHKIFEDTVELDKIERFVNEYSFLPSNSWKNVIEVLEPKVDSYIGLTADDLSREQQNDIVKLGLAYALYFPEEERFRPDQLKKLATLSREFRNVRVNRYTIDSFSALDNKATPMINDAVFEGQIKLVDIPKFIEYYNKVRKISELNKSIRGGGFEQ